MHVKKDLKKNDEIYFEIYFFPFLWERHNSSKYINKIKKKVTAEKKFGVLVENMARAKLRRGVTQKVVVVRG